MSDCIDKPTAIRKGEELDAEKLKIYLKKELGLQIDTFKNFSISWRIFKPYLFN